jgi:hypothetical protein
MQRLYRLAILVLMLGSLGLGYRSVSAIVQNPSLSPLVDRGTDELAAVVDRLMASEATAERLGALMSRRLAEDPRNWVALQALAEVHAERGLPLPASYQTAWDEDSGILATTGACLSCAWDIGTCSLSTALICKAPILLTPVEDLRGITKAGVDYAAGDEVDRLDLGLSVAGLSATALIVASGGSSASVKGGTALVRLARGMKLLSPGLAARMTAAFTDGIRWADVPAVRSIDDLPALMRTDVLAPVGEILADLGRTRDAIGTTRTLHLLPLVDDAADARSLAHLSEALGPRTVSRLEVIGKSRLFRATTRLSGTALELAASLIGLMAAIGAAATHLVQSMILRRLRPKSRRR